MTGAPLTLTSFLLARIDEDEADPACEGWGEYTSCRDWSDRHEAECAAKRAIVEVLAELGPESEPFLVGYGEALRRAARHLAAIYADHPDYDPSWRP